MQFAETTAGGGTNGAGATTAIFLPQMVLFGPDGSKVDQFCAVNRGDSCLAEADDFIDRLDGFLGEWPGVQTGPGTVGFATNAVAAQVDSGSVSVTVQRRGGDASGAQAFLLETHDGSATNGGHYAAVSANLTWAAGDSSSRTVAIPLLGSEGWRQPGGLTFSVTLAGASNTTAKAGVTNLTVTLASPLVADSHWTYDAGYGTWEVGPLSNGVIAELSWTAPRAGLLTFAGGQDGTNDFLSFAIDGAVMDSNTVVSLVNTVALAAGGRAAWWAAGTGDTNDTAFVQLIGWQPLAVPVPVAPADGAVFAPAGLPDLLWDTPPNGNGLLLNYGKKGAALAVRTNEVSGIGAAALGLTNGVYTWRVDNVVTGDFGTVALSAGPLWSFEVSERPAFPAAAVEAVFYLGIPSNFTVAASSPAPVTYSAKGLPAGLKLDPATGNVSGAPTRAGTFQVTVTAKSAKGTAAKAVGVTVRPLPAYASGAFQGLLLDGAGMVRGTLTLTVSSTGVPSLKIEAGGSTQTLKGVWQDAFTARFKTKAGDIIDLALTAGGGTGVYGGLSVVAARVLDGGAADAFAGAYTAVLGCSGAVATGGLDNVPEGYGYLTWTVAKKTGAVKYAGKLADGTSVSGSAKLIAGTGVGTVLFPLCKALYSKRGEAAARVTLGPNGVVAVDGGRWVYPGKSAKLPDDGFEAELAGIGAAYVKAGALAPFDGAALSAGGAEPLALLGVSKNKLVPSANTNGVTFSVTAASGVFSGTFKDGKASRAFKGVLVPPAATGAGYWLWPDPAAGSYRLNRSQPVEIGTP
jgi:hypothetical protein